MRHGMRFSAYAALASLVMIFSGCERDGDSLYQGGSGRVMSFEALANDSEGVRSELCEDGKSVKWSGDEKMGVFYTTQRSGESSVTQRRNACYTLSELSEDSMKATFVGDIEWAEIEGTHKFQIYYPYNADVTSPSKAFGRLPDEQSYDTSGWDISKYDFMVSGTASTTDTGSTPTINFKHLFSVLRLNITNNTGGEMTIERVKLSSKNGLILAGDFQANVGKSNTAEALHNATEVSNTDGYFTTPASSITTTVIGGDVANGEALDVRLMINAGLKDGSTEEYYLDGETLLVEVYTKGNPVWKSEFTAGKLARGARAVKRLAINPFDSDESSIGSFTPDYDPTSNRFYLNTIASATGKNIPEIVSLKVDGVAVAAKNFYADSGQITFRIPDTMPFDEAKSCAVVGYDGDGNSVELGEIKVYPFFYFKGIRLGSGSDSSKTYTQYAAENSFFVPDLGRVISAAEWRSTPIDSFAVNADMQSLASNPALSAKNTLDKTAITEEQYYASMPYFFFVAFSTNEFVLPSASNSTAVLKNHNIYSDGSFTPMMANKLYGTPILWYRTLSSDNSWSAAVKSGNLTSISAYNGTRPSSSAPVFGATAVDGGTWAKDAVIVTGYTSYTKGGKPSSLKDYAKLGFIHIREVTCADTTTGAALSPREGYVEFDFYWSKPLNGVNMPIYGDDSEPIPTPTPTPTPPSTGEGRNPGSYTISSVAELDELKPLMDGDEIIWKSGTYANVKITLTSDQKILNGITLRAETNGSVHFTGNSTLEVRTSRTTIRGLHWQDPAIDSEHLIRLYTGTSECKLVECAISGKNSEEEYGHNSKWVSLYGTKHRVENCSFIDKRDRGALLVVWFDEGVTPSHTIKNNYFTRPTILIDPNDGDPANEQETIRVGDSSSSIYDGCCTIQDNYFYRCWGESAEVVSNKSCANNYIGNFFHECKGTLTLRHGNNCLVQGNYFLGNLKEGELIEEAGGVRIIGEGHTVKGNHFESLSGIGYKAALSIVRGQENPALSGYFQVKNALIEENTFKECVLAIHANYGSSGMTLPVISTTIRNNTLVSTNTSNYIVRYETSTPEAEITWENNTLYGKFKNNYFSLKSLSTAPTLEDVSPLRKAIADAAGASWSIE